MALDLSSATFIGPAFPEPFVKFDLEKILNQNNLLPKAIGEEGKKLQEFWDSYRRKIRDLGPNSGSIRVRNYIVEPLIEILKYSSFEETDKIVTREGEEDSGVLLKTNDGKTHIRVWTVPTGVDLEAPVKRGYAYRFSHVRIAQRVLLAAQERVGILTDGFEIRILISDSARSDSQVIIKIDPDWKRSREVPDTFRFLIAITAPKGLEILPSIIDKARLKQSIVTKELRIQARQAIEEFIQGLLETPQNKIILDTYPDKFNLAKQLWQEGLIIVYRFLFVLKGEASDDPAKSFGFTGSSLWRNTYSPTVRLASFVRGAIDNGTHTGNLLEQGLRTIFKMFEQGTKSVELNITPLGGALFGENSTPLISKLHWPEMACARLLDKLLWTLPDRRGNSSARQRIHYGALDIEDLGRVYEALLELDPGMAQEKMCRLKRSKLEVVVPYAQGEKYKQNIVDSDNSDEDEEGEEAEEENTKSTKVQWIGEIGKGLFFLRVGLGRKSTGSYYTPHSFVRFLVQETLGPKIEECSPKDNPYPNKILKIKVLDPAMGSGHFLVEACRFIGDKLYEACRLCDEKALEFERKIEKESDTNKKIELKKQADEWRNRIIEIPDPSDEILKYLPSSTSSGETSGLSQKKAEALCKRFVAVHCLYGVDKNPLAVELAKLSLWLESQSEGYPLTFMDHRLVIGDSITGPFFEHLLKCPASQQPLDDIFNQKLKKKMTQALNNALSEVKELEKGVGINLTDITNKKASKERLETLLLPFKILAAGWSGGVMLGLEECDDMAYVQLARTISEIGKLPGNIESEKLLRMISKGLGIEEENLSWQDILKIVDEGKIIPALPYDLTFPEVFFELTERGFNKKGFDVVLGNPPWDAIHPNVKEFFASYDVLVLESPTARERKSIEDKLLSNEETKKKYGDYIESFESLKRINDAFFKFQKLKIEGDLAGRFLDFFRVFMERNAMLLCEGGEIGIVVPSAFHANEGATGVRKLYLEKMSLRYCFSFENKKKLFEIDSRFKFDILVARKNISGTNNFNCGFYLHNEEWLFNLDKEKDILTYEYNFIKKTDDLYLTFLELRSRKDLGIILRCFDNGKELGSIAENKGLFLRTNPAALNMSLDSYRFVNSHHVAEAQQDDARKPQISNSLLLKGYLILHEGKTFHQYNDLWSEAPRYLVPLKNLTDKSTEWIRTHEFYRVAIRAVSCSTNERTIISTLLPPGCVAGHTVIFDQSPEKRSNILALALVSIFNSFVFDWILRQRVGSGVPIFVLKTSPIPNSFEQKMFYLFRMAIRLISNNLNFSPLWQEQLGDNWREKNKKPFTWPVLATDEERWEVRSAIDAVVADAYGLNHEQYEHILHSFDSASGPNLYTDICLAKFDELKKIGLDKFTKKYDPYWDIPLNENLPKPVINLPIPEEKSEKDLFGEVITVSKKRGRQK